MQFLFAFLLISSALSQEPPGTAPTAAEILAENINGQTVHEFRGYYKREHSLIKPYTGSGVEIPHWNIVGSTFITSNQIRLTGDDQSKAGGLWNTQPVWSRDWELQVSFKVTGSTGDLFGDGMAIWYTSEPNQLGPVFGGKDYFRGLAVFLDTYSNHNGPHQHGHPFISAMVSDGSLHYDHDKDGTHTQLGGENTGCTAKFRNKDHDTQLLIRYVGDTLSIFTDIENKGVWNLCMSVNNVQLPTGYFFGVSAATGDLSDGHDVVSVKMFEQEFAHVERIGEADRRNVVPHAQFTASPRDHSDDARPSSLGWHHIIVILFSLAVALQAEVSSSRIFKERVRTQDQNNESSSKDDGVVGSMDSLVALARVQKDQAETFRLWSSQFQVFKNNVMRFMDETTASRTLQTCICAKHPDEMAEHSQCKCNRWVISLQASFERDDFQKLFRKAVQCISEEEFQKIPEMRHREDALLSLFSRLLYRYAAQKFTGEPWKNIKFERTEKGKPYLVSPADTKFGLNTSHQGDYVAFASSCSSHVGVDIMRLDTQRNNKTADEYINSMAKSASPEELRMMRSQPTEAMKMTMFYRYWCLKEAILKATGVGITNTLNSLDFRVNLQDRYRPGSFVTSTTVLEDGKLLDQWVFEETFVDGKHSAAVCKEKKLPRECVFRQDPEAKIFFSKITFDSLLEHAEIINVLPNDAADVFKEFMEKPRKLF
ncbi:unnamed protein product [Caenorhabditis sp. 36 PRJEB53466]|nr:unnamed protein product [Caenorhabditis sp. 36 PRJEB53466]